MYGLSSSIYNIFLKIQFISGFLPNVSKAKEIHLTDNPCLSTTTYSTSKDTNIGPLKITKIQDEEK